MIELRHPVRLRKSRPATIGSVHAPERKTADEATTESRGLQGPVRFFVDRAICVAVMAVTRGHAQRSRLTITCKTGIAFHVSVFASASGEGKSVFAAVSNDMCFFTGAGPSLYVMHASERDLESSIYLYLSERLKEQDSVSAQIFRERGDGHFDLPLLEGNSDEGVGSIKQKEESIL